MKDHIKSYCNYEIGVTEISWNISTEIQKLIHKLIHRYLN